jgi:hypothetical protein
MNDSTPSEPLETPVSTPSPTSLGARLINILVTPSDVFEEVKASPPRTANWLVPALVAMIVGWIGAWLVLNQEAIKQQFSDMQEKQYQKLIEQGRMTRDQLEAQRPMMDKVANISRQVGMYLVPPLSAFGLIFWWALVTFLLGRYVLGGRFSYMKAVEVSGLIGVWVILEAVIKTLLMLTFGSLFAGPNLAMVLVKDFDATNLTHGLLAAVDIVTFWVLTVRSIGLARLSGASMGKAAAWVFGLWILWTGFWTGVGYLMQRVFSGG